jgi:hypothetical protein
VKDVRPSHFPVRFEAVDFTASIHDDKDSPDALDIEWAVFPSNDFLSCESVDKAAWAAKPADQKTRLPSDWPYTFTPMTVEVVCVCVQAKDRNGASSFACANVRPANAKLVADIVDASGAVTGQKRPLCSTIHLVAREPDFPQEELDYKWDVQFSGGTPVQTTACNDVKEAAAAPAHRCFYAAAPGTYTATLTITDTPKGGAPTVSNVATFTVPVAEDAPPCLQLTEPGVYAKQILLRRSTYESRTLKVLSVHDDCEPYPGLNGRQAKFVWSWLDQTQSPARWVYQADTKTTSDASTFPVSPATFPNALPADSIKVRVEVRDAAVQQDYLQGHPACAVDQTDICVQPNDNDSDCVRWTTWTVQFQP